MLWRATAREKHEDGSAMVRYEAEGCEYAIESRRRPIRHTNGIGSWLYTSYFLIVPNGTEKEFYRLQDAKEAAEKRMKENERLHL